MKKKLKYLIFAMIAAACIFGTCAGAETYEYYDYEYGYIYNYTYESYYNSVYVDEYDEDYGYCGQYYKDISGVIITDISVQPMYYGDAYDISNLNLSIPNYINSDYSNESVVAIGSYAFSNLGNSITSLTIPSSISVIEYNAFGYCYNLECLTWCASTIYTDDYDLLRYVGRNSDGVDLVFGYGVSHIPSGCLPIPILNR